MQDQSTRMTEGTPWKHILKFTFPVFLGQLFQTLYNVVDSLVVGNFLDENALAAVVSSGNMIFLLVGFFTGLFTGASVIIARYFGARNHESLSKAVHTTVAFGFVAGILMSLLGLFLSPVILRWIDTPDSVYPHAVLYFRIYFGGAVFSILYSTAAGILQAVGNAQYPLRLLIFSSVLNIGLDLLFIGVFHMGVDGAAYATILSQCISAALAFLRLFRVKAPYRVFFRKIRFHKAMLLQILKLGIPSGFQNSIISISNIVIQSSINVFEEMAVAGCGIYSKVSDFVFLPIGSFSLALSTFVGQNLGARLPQRAKQGSRFGILSCVALSEAIGVVLILLAKPIMSLFSQNEEVLAYGVSQAKIVAPFYFLLSFSHVVSGVLRGAGKPMIPMIVMSVCWCLVRVIYILLIAAPSGNIQLVFWIYPITWFLSSAVFLIYYKRMSWNSTPLQKQA